MRVLRKKPILHTMTIVRGVHPLVTIEEEDFCMDEEQECESEQRKQDCEIEKDLEMITPNVN